MMFQIGSAEHKERVCPFFIESFKKFEPEHNAMLRIKRTVEEFGIEFPAMPEVGLSGAEVALADGIEGIVPVF